MALAIASQCCLLGCASRSGASATKEMPRYEIALRAPGPEKVVSTLSNAGEAVPLRKAVEQLVPSYYTVRWLGVEPARRNAPVTWNVNQEWPAAIVQAIASVPGLAVDIGTGTRLVLIRQVAPDLLPQPPMASATPAALATPATPSAMAATAVATPPKKKVTEAAPVVPVVRVESVARLQQVSVRKGVTPEPPVIGQPAALAAPRWHLSESDKTLKAVIERWAQEAGWRTFWDLGVDYPIVATASIGGSFEEAVSAVVRSMGHADVPPKAIFYRGNQVLRVVPRGME
jgi:hypothetical protein